MEKIARLVQFKILKKITYKKNERSIRVYIGENEYNKIKYPNKINTFARQPSDSTNVYWGFSVDKMFYKNHLFDLCFFSFFYLYS